MTIPAEGYPRAAAVSPRVHVLDHADSTNAKLLQDAAESPDTHPHLSLVLTRDQRAGRGRLDRVWSAPPGTALAVSVLLRVGAVALADRGWIPLVAGAALRGAISEQLPNTPVSLKWPNDVLVGAGAGARKISGILVEVLPSDPQTVVVTYVAGYAQQPPTDRQGVLEMVRHLWDTQRGSMAMQPPL